MLLKVTPQRRDGRHENEHDAGDPPPPVQASCHQSRRRSPGGQVSTSQSPPSTRGADRSEPTPQLRTNQTSCARSATRASGTAVCDHAGAPKRPDHRRRRRTRPQASHSPPLGGPDVVAVTGGTGSSIRHGSHADFFIVSLGRQRHRPGRDAVRSPPGRRQDCPLRPRRVHSDRRGFLGVSVQRDHGVGEGFIDCNCVADVAEVEGSAGGAAARCAQDHRVAGRVVARNCVEDRRIDEGGGTEIDDHSGVPRPRNGRQYVGEAWRGG